MEKIKILITEDLINLFSDFSGDKNPLHLDESFAKRTPFKKRIAHGTIILSKISQLLTQEMGEGNIIITEEIKFLKPAYIGDSITLNTERIKKNENGINEILIAAINQKNERILECNATCKKIYIKNSKNE